MKVAVPKVWKVEAKVAIGSSVKKGDIIATFISGSGDPIDITSPMDGTVIAYDITGSDRFFEIKDNCSHAVIFNGLCALCSKDLTISDATREVQESSNATVDLLHGSSGIRVSWDEAKRQHEKTSSRLLKERRLSLLVDLDHTILHASTAPYVSEWIKNENHVNHHFTQNEKELFSFTLDDDPSVIYYVKTRPGLYGFLERMVKKYEMHIYTHGTRSYALKIAENIDPQKRYFNDRIISREDGVGSDKKSIQRLFPCNDDMVLVLDDRPNYWNWPANVIPILQYLFFPGVGDINNNAEVARMSNNPLSALMELGSRPISDKDKIINVIEGLLNRVHEKFYSSGSNSLDDNRNVKEIMTVEKQKIFKGFTFCFSRIIPLDRPYEKDENVKLAEMFGAKCIRFEVPKAKGSNLKMSDVPAFTHVISNGVTPKVLFLKRINPKIHVVSLPWLRESVFYFEKKRENDFLVDLTSGHAETIAHAESLVLALAENDSESEESSYVGEESSVEPLQALDASVFDELQRELDEELGENWSSSEEEEEDKETGKRHEDESDEPDENEEDFYNDYGSEEENESATHQPRKRARESEIEDIIDGDEDSDGFEFLIEQVERDLDQSNDVM